MQNTITKFGIVDTTLESFPVLAVNALDRLGYSVSRASKQLDQVLAVERLDEQVGRDWWRHEYRVVLNWSMAATGGIQAEVEIREVKGGGTQHDCQRRADEIINRLQTDAQRAQTVAKTKNSSTAYGAAEWGNEQSLQKAGYITKNPQPTRLIIGRTQNNEYISVPELVTNAHALVCGRTGVGKSRGFFIPNLIERLGTNMIVTEATPGYEPGELYTLTSGWRERAGHNIYSFNPADMSSTRINPIDRVRLAAEIDKAREAEKLADLIVLNGSQSGVRVDPTWDRSEKQLLTALILHAAATDPELGHIGALRWLLLSGIGKVRKIMAKSKSDLAQIEFEGWLTATSENFRFGVLSGLMTKLNPWMTDQLCALTEKTDINFEDLQKNLFTFYLAVPSRSQDSKLIGSLLVNFLLDFLLDNKSLMKYPTGMLLDEFTNFGKIANIADVLSIIRKAKISLVLGFQNYHQLERVYSPNEARIIIDQPATQIYFRQKNFHEARVLSDALGKTTIEEVTVSDSGRVQEFIQGRALATPEELINLKDQVIAFTNDTWPLKLPVASPVAYHHAMDYPPPERPTHSISETVQRRGRNCAQMNDVADGEDPNPKKGGRNKKGNGAGAGKQSTPDVDPQLDPTVQPSNDTNTNSNPSQERPEVDDIWSY
ncbi:MAG: type IV secretory system conjugative DNA transfer family protein [Candidatus Obscuribacterales bacterium]|nr:type IV secretory system conjugative DNA transfer family protein [Candidatus Obscuribacterales bacterium]